MSAIHGGWDGKVKPSQTNALNSAYVFQSKKKGYKVGLMDRTFEE